MLAQCKMLKPVLGLAKSTFIFREEKIKIRRKSLTRFMRILQTLSLIKQYRLIFLEHYNNTSEHFVNKSRNLDS
jgi:hypothetical protein